ncbi:PspC domain protein [uncultured archaeon]|nr:PspC domain protein [uncultured archaeon]
MATQKGVKTNVQKKEIKRLYRSKTDRVIAGVCGGIGEYLGIDPVIVRLVWVLLTLCAGAGILAYILAWVIIPKEK